MEEKDLKDNLVYFKPDSQNFQKIHLCEYLRNLDELGVETLEAEHSKFKDIEGD